MQSDFASAMSIDNSPGPSSLNTPLPSTHHLKPCPNLDLWELNSEELVRFVPMRKLIAVALTHRCLVPFQGPYIEGEKLRG